MSDSREPSVNALTGPDGIGGHSTLLPFGYTMIEAKSGSNPLRKLVEAAAADSGKVLKIVVGVYRASTGKQLYTFTMTNAAVVPDSAHLAHGWFSFAIANSQVPGKPTTVSATGNLKIPGAGTVGSTRYSCSDPGVTCPPSGSPVAFRLDDVQNGFCRYNQMAIIDTFLEAGVPLSIGIIGEAFATGFWDQTITNHLKSARLQEAIQAGKIQIVNHGYEHPEPPGMVASWGDAEKIEADINQCAKTIMDLGILRGKKPAYFIAPTNNYDTMTEQGAQRAGITAISAQCSVESSGALGGCTPPGLGKIGVNGHGWMDPLGMYQVPAGAVLEADGWTNYASPGDFPAAMGWAARQVARQGYALFMMHPQEFTTDNCATASASDPGLQSKTGMLKRTLAALKAQGVEFYTISGLLNKLDPTANSAPYQ